VAAASKLLNISESALVGAFGESQIQVHSDRGYTSLVRSIGDNFFEMLKNLYVPETSTGFHLRPFYVHFLNPISQLLSPTHPLPPQ
jgi:hypothetical protein